MVPRARDWFRQVLGDLELAKRLVEAGYCEWACFIAQ
ncbi:MAG: HEPN domain-containing protein [Desulfurococcaceae archaeon]